MQSVNPTPPCCYCCCYLSNSSNLKRSLFASPLIRTRIRPKIVFSFSIIINLLVTAVCSRNFDYWGSVLCCEKRSGALRRYVQTPNYLLRVRNKNSILTPLLLAAHTIESINYRFQSTFTLPGNSIFKIFSKTLLKVDKYQNFVSSSLQRLILLLFECK